MYIALIVILALACLFFGIKFTQVTEGNDNVKAVLFKGLTTVCCIVIAAIAVFHTTNKHFAVLVMFGVFFGFLGDELLALRFVFPEKFNLCFASGAMSFFVGHVFYVIALYGIAPKAWIVALPLLVIAVLLELQNTKKHNLQLGKLFAPLSVYCTFVCFMGWRSTEKDRKIPHFIYKSYPRLRVVLSHRCEAYNRQLDLVDELERRGDVVCIRPERPLEVGRMEKDVSKLERLYEEGLRLGEKFCKDYL